MKIPTENLDAMVQFLTDVSETSGDHLMRAADMLRAQQQKLAELEKSVEWWQGCTTDCGDVINDGIESRQQLRTKVAELEAQAAIGRLAVEMLRAMQWQYGGEIYDTCPHCYGAATVGHTSDCELAAILRDATNNGMGVES